MACEWWQRAAEQGHLRAQFELGRVLWYGDGIAKNKEQAIGLFVKAAKGEYKKAINVLLGLYVQNRISNPDNYGLNDEKLSSYVELQLQSIDKEYIENVYTNIGLFYLGKKNHPKALYYFKLGREKRELQSLLQLAPFFNGSYFNETTKEFKPDLDELSKLWKETAGLLDNPNDPVFLNDKGANLLRAIDLLSKITKIGKEKIEQYRNQAAEYFDAAYKGGCKKAIKGLLAIYKESNPDEYTKHLLIVENDNDEDVLDRDVLFDLAEYYYNQGEDLDKTIKYYQKAIEKGSTLAAHNYANIKLFNLLIELGKIESEEWQNNLKLHEGILKDIKSKLSLIEKEFAEAKFLYAVVCLLLSPEDNKLILKDLEAFNKPFKLLDPLKRYLRDNDEVIVCELKYFLLGCPDPLAEIDSYRKEKASKLEASEERKQKQEDAVPKPDDYMTRPSKSKEDRIRDELQTLTDPKNRKTADFATIKKLMQRASFCTPLKYEERHSGGSGNKAQLGSLFLFQHLTHKKGSGMGSAYDPKRAKSVQTTGKEMSVLMSEIEVEHEDRDAATLTQRRESKARGAKS